MTVTRRQFAPAAASLAAIAATSPAFGQQTNEIVKMATHLELPQEPRHALRRLGDHRARRGRDDRRQVPLTPFAAGEIVPGLQVLDAVSNNTVECGHTYTGYYIGKNPSFIFDGSLPFGLTPRMHNAWMMFGDGRS